MGDVTHPIDLVLRTFRARGWATPTFTVIESLQECATALPDYKKPVRLLRTGDHPVVGGLLVRHKADLEAAWSTLRPQGPLLMRREPPGARLWCARPESGSSVAQIWECAASMGELRGVQRVPLESYPVIGDWVAEWLAAEGSDPNSNLESESESNSESNANSNSNSNSESASGIAPFEGWYFGANGPNACLLGVGFAPGGIGERRA